MHDKKTKYICINYIRITDFKIANYYQINPDFVTIMG